MAKGAIGREHMDIHIMICLRGNGMKIRSEASRIGKNDEFSCQGSAVWPNTEEEGDAFSHSLLSMVRLLIRHNI